MSDFELAVAGPDDDGGLTALIGRIVTPGSIELVYSREPSFFEAAVTEGDGLQVVALKHGDKVIGCGVRSRQKRFVNGEARPVGYLSSLRLDPCYHGRALPVRAFRYLRELHGDGRLPFYLTTVTRGNETARRLLDSGARGLPAYIPAGRFFTFVLPIPRRVETMCGPGLSIRPATADDAVQVHAFVSAESAKRQFAPDYATVAWDSPRFRDLRKEDLLLAFRGERLVGMLGSWDQTRFRQTVVHRYTGPLAWGRRAINMVQRLRRRPLLPNPGESLRYRFCVLPLIENHDPTVLDSLLSHVMQASRRASAEMLLLGMHESDPLFANAQRHTSIAYETDLFMVAWEAEALPALDPALPIYLEAGCL